LNKKFDVIIPVPTFSLYEKYSKIFHANVKYIFLKEENEFSFDIEEIYKKISKNTRIIFLCSPNNPTGKSISNEILKIVEENPKIYFFIDEAFIEFSDNKSLCEYVNNFENLFVSRSMTKFFSLAGLRIGYGIGNKKIIRKLLKRKVEWNVNSLAQIAGIESLKDFEYIQKSKILLKEEKKKFFDALSNINKLKVYPSDANFFLINLKSLKARYVKKKMLENGILIRDCSNFKGLDDNYIRACVNNTENNEKFVNIIKKIMS
ncbi:MAG: pyridoxal phosphate-dependent aminotransferase, partial [Candidatus Altarchaeaceae archaeon]